MSTGINSKVILLAQYMNTIKTYFSQKQSESLKSTKTIK